MIIYILEKPIVYEEPINPCVPTPCGPNSQCSTQNSLAVCSCLPSYIGRAPNCRPECTVNSDCPSSTACINQKCKNPCIGSCGNNAECTVASHIPLCTCSHGFIGDPFRGCYEQPQCKKHSQTNSSAIFQCLIQNFSVTYLPPDETPCQTNPCGVNANCRELNGAGSCACIPDYHGDPYVGCRPECMMNSECPMNRACINLKCVDPCPGVCGNNAKCSILNHSPTCTCDHGFRGNPFESCSRIPPSKIFLFTRCNIPSKIFSLKVIREEPIVDPCQPSPCGGNSQCRKINNIAVCSCIPTYVGSPPNCRPECVVNADCSLDRSCISQKCKDPCPGTCGINARCNVVNHSPICSCNGGFSGDPFIRCIVVEESKSARY